MLGAAVLEQLVDVVAVGGLTMGADPVALATAIVATQQGRALRAFSIRKEAKGHGTGGRLVGPVGAGDRVSILEDTTTTGGAFFEAIDEATREGLDVAQALVLVDRSGSRVADLMSERGIEYSIVLRPSDLGFDQ